VSGARILPELAVRRGRSAIEFYKAAFGAAEDYRVGGTDEHEPVVAQLSVGNARFAAVERAVGAGATLLAPVAEEHGWRMGRIADPFGHHWEVGTPLGPWPGVSA
jgi:PhnB protein